eukprot:GHVS01081083.1.p1 GENE.GHVS01081083.1~~GHVS01081083.1.p1  ORF type:complete len:101 (-),score=11.56 GHVS01081083.1:507-809(-)
MFLFDDIATVNRFLRSHGIALNCVGGEVKGDRHKDLLQQSSTIAEKTNVKFSDGNQRLVASCYYEFAQRFWDERKGKLFGGFVPESANKIFESTHTTTSV